MGTQRNTYGILVAKPEGKEPVGKPGYRKEDNIKMDAREIWWGVINSISLV
jgi:hypothetical protein